MAKLYLIRHGLPELPGDEPVCLGAADAPLSREGREQMKGLREFVRQAGIRRIYVSDLVRSRESGEILSGGEIPVTVREELRENAMGAWETLSFREIRERFPEEYRRRGEDLAGYAPKGGESFRSCQRRALAACRRILSELDGNAAIVGHVGFFRSLICALEGRELSRLMDVDLPCGGVYEWPAGPALGAVILAAGRSSRMGALKPLLPAPEGTLLSREI
jgi:probable phosphoglycerate mutase